MNAEQRVDEIRKEWGRKLLIVGHHYQDRSILRHVDAIGDSLELSRRAAEAEAERIVFCGVHFMAESAAIMSRPGRAVYMPDPSAGCPMADMAALPEVETAWEMIRREAADWIPVVYVNSTAEIKAFCGRWGGSTCTSSNAAAVIRWVFSQGKRVFFLPDEHLGWNTGHDLGIADADMAVYDPKKPDGGIGKGALGRTRILVWKGYCRVHTVFRPEQIAAVRRLYPDARVIVHPECAKEVVRAADAHGSTSQIITYVRNAADGSVVVVGTENHLVQRLAEDEAGRVRVLALQSSSCSNMAKTRLDTLLAVLEGWPAACRVRVDPEVIRDARLALDRMLAL